MFRYIAMTACFMFGVSALAKGMEPISPNDTYFLKDYGRCQIIRPSDDGKFFEVLQNGLSIKLVPADAFKDPTCMKLSSVMLKPMPVRQHTADLSPPSTMMAPLMGASDVAN